MGDGNVFPHLKRVDFRLVDINPSLVTNHCESMLTRKIKTLRKGFYTTEMAACQSQRCRRNIF